MFRAIFVLNFRTPMLLRIKRMIKKKCKKKKSRKAHDVNVKTKFLKAIFEIWTHLVASARIIDLPGDSWPMMLAAATLYWSQSTGVHRQPTAHYCRLSCPNCGRSYKYRSGLRGHIADCFSEREKLEADFRQRQEQRGQEQQQQQRQQFTEKDVRVLYKFWKS